MEVAERLWTQRAVVKDFANDGGRKLPAEGLHCEYSGCCRYDYTDLEIICIKVRIPITVGGKVSNG
jgi:hypothetical protein